MRLDPDRHDWNARTSPYRGSLTRHERVIREFPLVKPEMQRTPHFPMKVRGKARTKPQWRLVTLRKQPEPASAPRRMASSA